MATGSGNTTVYDCQKAACQKLFVELLPDGRKVLIRIQKDKVPANMRRFKGPIYDITGLDAHQEIAVLVSIVNDKDQFKKGKTFYLLLRNDNENKPDDEVEELFRLKAMPTEDQPGNGIVFLRPRKNTTFKTSGKTYTELNGELEAKYDRQGKLIDTASFATDIMKLFQNNAAIKNEFPQPTIEVYFLWLFEIARRLVNVGNPNGKKDKFAVLPIGSAIARIVKLLSLGKPETCKFKDVLLPREKFDAFTGNDQKSREKAIDEINKITSDIFKSESMVIPYNLRELEEIFCSEERRLDILGKQLQDFKKKTEEHSSMKSSFDAESSSVEDYFAKDSQE